MKKTDEDLVCVPFVVHEAALFREEKRRKTLWAMFIAAVGLLLSSNATWLMLWFFGR